MNTLLRLWRTVNLAGGLLLGSIEAGLWLHWWWIGR